MAISEPAKRMSDTDSDSMFESGMYGGRTYQQVMGTTEDVIHRFNLIRQLFKCKIESDDRSATLVLVHPDGQEELICTSDNPDADMTYLVLMQKVLRRGMGALVEAASTDADLQRSAVTTGGLTSHLDGDGHPIAMQNAPSDEVRARAEEEAPKACVECLGTGARSADSLEGGPCGACHGTGIAPAQMVDDYRGIRPYSGVGALLGNIFYKGDHSTSAVKELMDLVYSNMKSEAESTPASFLDQENSETTGRHVGPDVEPTISAGRPPEEIPPAQGGERLAPCDDAPIG